MVYFAMHFEVIYTVIPKAIDALSPGYQMQLLKLYLASSSEKSRFKAIPAMFIKLSLLQLAPKMVAVLQTVLQVLQKLFPTVLQNPLHNLILYKMELLKYEASRI